MLFTERGRAKDGLHLSVSALSVYTDRYKHARIQTNNVKVGDGYHKLRLFVLACRRDRQSETCVNDACCEITAVE